MFVRVIEMCFKLSNVELHYLIRTFSSRTKIKIFESHVIALISTGGDVNAAIERLIGS